MNLLLDEVRQAYFDIGLSCRDEVSAARETVALPWSLWKKIAAEGIFRLDYREHLPVVASALEGLCHAIGDSGVAISIIAQAGLSLPAIQEFGSPRLKDQCLGSLVDGDGLIAFAITEPQGGSDAYSARATLTRDGDGYRLNGQKWHITNMPDATWIAVLAKLADTQEPVLVVIEAEQDGVEIGRPLSPVGMRSSPIASATFDEVRVAGDAILGSPKITRNIVRQAFVRERILTPFPILGCMDDLCDRAVVYSSTRKVFGSAIGEFQHIQKRLTDAKVLMESTRALAHDALRKYLAGEEASSAASIAKMYSASAFVELSTTILQIFGSHGYGVGDNMGHLILDAVGATIAGGTEEVHRKVIFQEMFLDTMKRLGKGSRLEAVA